MKGTKNNKGITLVALVVTIVVMLILAGVSINLIVGKNGIITKANEAKKETIKSAEKSAIELAVTSIKTTDIVDDTSSLNADNLKIEIEKNYGENSVDVKGENMLIVTFTETGNKYLVNSDGIVIEVDNVTFDLVYYTKAQDAKIDIVIMPISRNKYRWNS